MTPKIVPSDPEKVKEIELELLTLFEECKKEGMSKEEIRQVFSPLGLPKVVNRMANQGQGSWSKVTLLKVKELLVNQSPIWISRMLGLIILLTIFGVIIGRNEEAAKNLRFHGLAVLRIALIKVLPYWKWTDMYYSRCLVRNPFFEVTNLNEDDCNLCESLEEVLRVWNVSQDHAIEDFIRREKPFIVTDAMDDWDIMQTDQFWFDNITEIYLHQDNYQVCNVNTNLRIPNGDFTRLLRRLYNPRTTEWFIHWENCQKEMSKAVRAYYRRPYFISNSLDFTGSNWVFMSSDFKGRVYKRIEGKDSLLLVYQVRGANHIRISPRDTCRGQCPEFYVTLKEGEILAVTNLVWIVEYIPGEVGDNLALASEVSLPSRE